MVDRVLAWEQLVQFARYDAPAVTLGLVHGRRRQGKSFLLDLLDGQARRSRGHRSGNGLTVLVTAVRRRCSCRSGRRGRR